MFQEKNPEAIPEPQNLRSIDRSTFYRTLFNPYETRHWCEGDKKLYFGNTETGIWLVNTHYQKEEPQKSVTASSIDFSNYAEAALFFSNLGLTEERRYLNLAFVESFFAREYDSNSPYQFSLAKSESGESIGCAIWKNLTPKKTAFFLELVMVSPSYQNSGAGRLLVNQFRKQFSGLSFLCSILPLTKSKTEEGVRFYKSKLRQFYLRNGLVWDSQEWHHVFSPTIPSIDDISIPGIFLPYDGSGPQEVAIDGLKVDATKLAQLLNES